MSMSPLRQPIHIFRKDALHLWPEILVSIGLLVAFAWADVQTWLPANGEFNPAAFGAGLLRFLIPVSWLVLVSRLVHDEELVGDRQFWTTRPYTWYSLLAAKLLFLVAFLLLPFLIMQMVLLKLAGLYPTQALGALLHNQVFFALVFVLPLLAVAAVTATFIRFASSMLVGLIYVFAVVLFGALRWQSNLGAPGMNVILGGVAVAVLVAATVLQYALRRTLISRLMLIALPLVFLLMSIATPGGLLTEAHYPDKTLGELAFSPNPLIAPRDGRLLVLRDKVSVSLPVSVKLEDLPEHAYVEAQRIEFVLDGPNGVHYASGWEPTRNFFGPRSPMGRVFFALPQSVFDRLHGQSARLHVELAVQTFDPGTAYSIDASEKPFPVPAHGVCHLDVENGEIECRYPFGNPQPTQVAATVHSGDCLMPGPQTAEAVAAIPPSILPVGFDPLDIERFQLAVREQKVSLCPGTRTTFTPSVPGDLRRMKLDVPSLQLDTYAVRIPVGETVR